jgi:cytochrome oxidase assembly protein ShyY1
LKVKNKRLSQFKEEMDQEPEPLCSIQESSISATDDDYGSTKRWKKYQLTGNFLDKFMYVGPRTKHAGAVGHMIIQPFQLQSSKDIVLINRGWVSDSFLKKGKFPAAPIGATNIIVARNLGDKVCELNIRENDSFNNIYSHIETMVYFRFEK